MLRWRRIRKHNKRNIIVLDLELNYEDMLLGSSVTYLQLNNESEDYYTSFFVISYIFGA